VGKVVVQALEGEPSQVLLDAARDFDADLIVVGSRGLTSHAHFILGSVASSVAHHAPCDVLVAHTTKVDA
jgi:nucleotide-binding universal stress UspA family protein